MAATIYKLTREPNMDNNNRTIRTWHVIPPSNSNNRMDHCSHINHHTGYKHHLPGLRHNPMHEKIHLLRMDYLPGVDSYMHLASLSNVPQQLLCGKANKWDSIEYLSQVYPRVNRRYWILGVGGDDAYVWEWWLYQKCDYIWKL